VTKTRRRTPLVTLGGVVATFRIRTLGLICLVIGSVQCGWAQTSPTARHRSAYSRTASDITGDIILSSTRIVFQNGVSLELSYVGESPNINLDSYGLAGPVHLFQVKDARVVSLLNGNTLCGPIAHPIPATFIATISTRATELGVAIFSGEDDLTASNFATRLCGTYRYSEN
jgi:hypothetical protein